MKAIFTHISKDKKRVKNIQAVLPEFLMQGKISLRHPWTKTVHGIKISVSPYQCLSFGVSGPSTSGTPTLQNAVIPNLALNKLAQEPKAV